MEPIERLTRVLIVAPVRVVAESLARVLASSELDVVGVLLDAGAARERVATSGADVVMVDAALSDALVAVRAVAEQAIVVVIGLGDDLDDVLPYLAAGATGYVRREASLDEMAAALTAATRGGMICSPAVAQVLRDRALPRRNGQIEAILSPREREVLELIELGLSNRHIADQLGIGLSTVKNHVSTILDKLQCRSRTQAVALYAGRLIAS